MSKSKKNLVNPSKIIDAYGVDAVRLFIVSDTPPEKDLDWNTDALEGSWRFLKKVWNVFEKITPIINGNYQGSDDLIKTTHFYMKKISYCLENIMLNKAVAHIRELFNEIEDSVSTSSSQALRFAFISFVKTMEPITPFISHEILEILGESNNSWPEIDEELASEDNVTIAIQVNGKLKGTFEVPMDTDEKTLESLAMEKLGMTEKAKNIIVVKNKIVNVVV
jgi:leucyl-tRNA synthetase